MGFRNPVTSLVDDYARELAEDALAKAENALTWLNSQTGAGTLQAFDTAHGSGVLLSSSPEPIQSPGDTPTGRTSSIELRSTELDGDATTLESVGRIVLQPAPGKTVRITAPIEEQVAPGVFRRIDGSRWGIVTVTTDSAGLALIPHTMPTTPSAGFFAAIYQSDGVSGVFVPTLGAITATHLQLVALRNDTSPRSRLVASLRVYWEAKP